MSRRRGLRPEERELWEQVARSARPMHGRAGQHLAPPPPPKRASPPTSDPGVQHHAVPIPRKFAIGRSSAPPGHDLARPITEALKSAPVAMDKRQFSRMSKGRLDPEARIDLHGMTLEQARGVLGGFIVQAQLRGLRLVLVITGKGRSAEDDGPIPRRRGALRHEVPLWLRAAPLGPMVLDIRPAHRRHGGEGALYVYLRRRRGQGGG